VLFARARRSGNAKFQTKNIPKVVGGITAECTATGALFYQQALETVVPVSSTRVAEMVKLLENTFRMINIGLANEIAMMCERMNINVWEVIDAAATKPFGFMAFYPGPAWAATAFPSTRFISPGKPSRRALKRASSSSRATSMARCRTSWSTKFRTR
jgi:UDP-N-acetyl-D-glucosamine dehydrogenase